eukprot:CAMPEP_0172191100 /NCGR_PEP_ID=MMETSP1050-20130122/23504_1 /TAXON_ID=233186 /ORGANISM="Cryptomonas curvata, Strain CCAP979/52" /LENGTH=51 /DNA_ID=CAMNT_0012866093 /DNA_START=200 /DNA_END=355 /DNA_ORIENTATION=+
MARLHMQAGDREDCQDEEASFDLIYCFAEWHLEMFNAIEIDNTWIVPVDSQ